MIFVKLSRLHCNLITPVSPLLIQRTHVDVTQALSKRSCHAKDRLNRGSEGDGYCTHVDPIVRSSAAAINVTTFYYHHLSAGNFKSIIYG
mmetsp:Transcript_15712/g.37587  ORF Transcript_15712/g.37587 Transcript_15712/m.37587 type:complete len:90 (+) Transcript_15712:166-435(+)